MNAEQSQTAVGGGHRLPWAMGSLVLVNVLVVVVLVVMAVLSLRLSRQSLADRALVNAENLAFTLQQNVVASMGRIDFALQTARLAFESRPQGNAGEPRDFDGVLSRIDDLLGGDASLRVADAQGWIRHGQSLPSDRLVNVGDRSYFRQARDGAFDAMAVSEPLQSRVTGRWVVAMARALRDREGRFAGVVYVAVERSFFQRMFAAVDLGRMGAISLRHDDLRLIARQSEQGPSDDGIGTNKVSDELRRALSRAPQQGSYVARTAIDGVERANAYVRVGSYPLLILVGLATEDVLVPWRVQIVQVVSLLLLVLVLMATVSVLAYRHWQRGVSSAQAAARAQEQQGAAERERQLLQGQLDERDEFVRVLAHEVRQPLNNASAALQSARSALTDSQPMAPPLPRELPAAPTAAAARVQRAEAVIGQIIATLDNTLAVSALLASPGRVHGGDADVSLLIDLSIGDLGVAVRPRVQVLRDSATRTAWMDVGLMRLALRNVLGNALAYSQPETHVQLRVSDSEDPLGLVFEVFDEGIGVSDELKPRLFERGVRGAHHVPGHGIGLYVVRRVMELHGGSVDLRPNDPRGTVFRLWLPQD